MRVKGGLHRPSIFLQQRRPLHDLFEDLMEVHDTSCVLLDVLLQALDDSNITSCHSEESKCAPARALKPDRKRFVA